MTTATSEHAELMDVIGHVWDQMGCRGTKQEVISHLQVMLADHLRDYLVGIGLSTKVGQFFRRLTEAGLPQAPEIDGHGTHAQLELLTVEDFRYVIGQQMRNSDDARRRAQQYSELCHDRYGLWIDLDNPYPQADTGT